jgi:predicted DNA-binding protein
MASLSSSSLQMPADEMVSVSLPRAVVTMLEIEAKRSRKPIAEFMANWLQDQRDGREATKVLKRIKEGKEKTYPAAEVWERHGI